MSTYIYHIEDSAGNKQTCLADDHQLDNGVLVLYTGRGSYHETYEFLAGYAGWSKFWRVSNDSHRTVA